MMRFFSLPIIFSILRMAIGGTLPPSNNQKIKLYGVDWSTDGSRIIVLTDAIYVYDREFHLVAKRRFDKPISYISISPDGTLLAFQNEIWKTDTLKSLFQLDTAYVLGDWSADGRFISGVAPKANGIVIYDTQNGKLVKTVKVDDIQLAFNPRWSPDGRYFAATHKRFTLVIVDANNHQAPKRYPQRENVSLSIAWSHDGTRIAFTGWAIVPQNTSGNHVVPAGDTIRDSVYIMDALTGSILKTFTGLPDGVTELIWSPDDQELLAAVGVTKIFIWDTQSGKLNASYQSVSRIVGINYSTFGGQVMLGLDLSFISHGDGSKPFTERVVTHSFLDGAIQMIVPSPSLEKLKSITQACQLQPNVQEALISQIDANDLNTFKTYVSALTNTDIPEGCKADLLAVADALMAK